MPFNLKKLTSYNAFYNNAKSNPYSIFFRRLFKNFFSLFFLTITFCANSIAQSTANYTTSFSATASMHPMSNSIKVLDINQDDVSSVVIKIGFDFWFMGKCYSQLSMNSNGAIRLGNIPISNTEYIGAGSTTPFPQTNRAIIAPFLANLATSGTGLVQYELSGTAPNRKFTVEFMNMKIKNTSTLLSGTFQVSLNETSGIINFDYSNTFTVGTQATF
jgi:trimeric autotransporter adhesin